MAIDLSRSAFDSRKRYAGVRMQMGRLLSDDDFNDGSEIAEEEHRRTLLDVIGPVGTPDTGFAITNPSVTGGALDFTLGPGTLYVGGLRLETDGTETFQLQDDWLQQAATDRPTPPAGNRFDLVWIEVVLQDVTAVEDSELYEVAFGVADTSARTRAVRRVRVFEDIGSARCEDGWESLLLGLAVEGSLDDGLQFAGDDSLTVSYDPGGDPNDLCTPSVAGGYLGAQNQAVRVQLVDDGGALTWGFDNGAPLHRVQVSADANGNRRVITMLTDPLDQPHWPRAGQVVELLPWSAVLPNGEKIAEREGLLARVDGSYDPGTRQLTIVAGTPAGFGTEWKSRADAASLGAEYVYMRVWDRGADTTSPLAIPCPPATAVPLQHTGLSVTINGTARAPGDHWIIAARPHTPTRVVPWDLESGRSPHGYRRWIAPLGVISWDFTGGGGLAPDVVDDCREWFPPLTRQRTCCTYTVGDGIASHGRFDSIQEAIDRLPPEGGQVCLLPGRYTENVLISERRRIVLSGCGLRSIVTSERPSAGTAAGPVIEVHASSDITVRDLAVVAHQTGPGILVGESSPTAEGIRLGEASRRVRLHDLIVGAVTRGAIEVHGATDVEVRGCWLEMRDLPSSWPALFFRADEGLIEGNHIVVQGASFSGKPLEARAALGGIQIAGTSDRVRVRRNFIQGGIGNGITLGSVRVLDGNGGDRDILIAWVINADDPCSPCKPGEVIIVFIPGDDGDGDRLVSAGPMHEIEIEDNEILDMGLNGIGVIGFFPPDSGEIISVFGLDIARNEISRCLWRELADIDRELENAAAYGGISLADVSDLVIRENVIEHNGRDGATPVCGVFVLHGDGIEIAGNRIRDNGPSRPGSEARGRRGRRSGIDIALATMAGAPGHFILTTRPASTVPALHVCDNVVSQPLGPALSAVVLGPTLVHGNHLSSQGVPPREALTAISGATVTLLQLGRTHEFGGQYTGGFTNYVAGPMYTPYVGASTGVTAALLPRIGASAELRAPNGNVLFSDNQCLLTGGREADDRQRLLALASVTIMSLDDIGFTDNQCDCRTDQGFVLTDLLALGWSLRVIGNRLKEGWSEAALSGITLGVMNMTAQNQATHCLLIRGLGAGMTVSGPNTEFVEMFSSEFCERFTALLGGGGRIG